AAFMKPEEILRRPNLKMAVTTTVPLEHIRATKATATVRPFFAGGGAGAGSVQIGTAGSEQMVLLSGFADQIVAAVKLFREVDKAANADDSPDVYERLLKIERRLTALEKRSGAATQTGRRK
ncbi:MAG: hypothetical protein V3U11_14295, partial [Planctomycetota bacterium]